MTSEALTALVRADLAASLAILAVLILRLPARALFGARLAYGLWLLVPAVFLANLAPPRTATGLDEPVPAAAELSARLAAMLDGPAPAVWLAGALVAAALVAWNQHRFLQRAARGEAGPAVVGVFAPRMVAPADHHRIYTPEERALVRAHERAHIDRGDPRVNALIAFGQCLNWFNPLIHVAARYARMDQELACDATVMARHPRQRRRYAETLLKTQLAPTALPLGCHWTAHPLETRIAMLAAPSPSDRRVAAGGLALTTLAMVAVYAAWAAQPERAPPLQHVQFDRSPTMVVLMVDMKPTNDTVVLSEGP